ncbi:MAG: kynureninase [Proteobacteria bacterium]|nr:kynureninase [Pseudomonadota bacterium]
MVEYSKEFFQDLDSRDELSSFRKEFYLPENLKYFDGNSLGAMPLSAEKKVAKVLCQEWGQDLISSWNKNGWFHLAEKLGNRIASIIGANSGEVMVCDSTGLNLYKALSLALDMRPERKSVLMEGSNFPTDNYMAQGLIKQMDNKHQINFVEKDNLIEAITEDVAVVSLTQVHYKTGHLLDMMAITKKAHEVGALVIWDLCHSAGALSVNLNECNADFAVGCSYKYLNGGPGAPAFIFVAQRHQGKAQQPLTGWWSHADPFAFERDYRPVGDIWQTMTGTQPILSMSVLECGLEIMNRADIIEIRKKSVLLCDYFIELMEQYCGNFGFSLVTPRQGEERGSQVSFTHKNGYAVMQALIADKVVGDFRAPDIVRFGFAPLYIRYIDIWDGVMALKNIMENELWKKVDYSRGSGVT